jgi:hypothetical protein
MVRGKRVVASRRPATTMVRRFHRDERGQSLAIILALITVLFLMGSALAVHASVALRTTVANEAQAGDLYGADAGAELGMWWQRNGKAGNPPNITVNGLTVSTTVGVAGTVPCSTPSPIKLTGFEHGVLSTTGGGLFSNVNGAGVTIDGAVARTGAYSLKIVDPAGSTDSARIAVGTGIGVVRLYLRLASLPAADVGELLSLDAAAGNDLRIGYQSSTTRLTIRFGNTAVTTASSSIAAGTWYRLDIRMVANTNPRTADWRIDGVAQTSISWAGTASTINSLRFGSTVSADPYSANYDDVMVTATSGDFPIGSGTVVALRPDGMGTSVNTGSFREDDGSVIDANSYNRLDDSPISDTTQYVRQQTIGTGDYLELTFDNTSTNCVTGVSGILAFRSATTAANDGKTSIFDGSTERIILDGDMSQTTQQYVSAILNPASAPWTPSAVNGLKARIGYSSDVTPNPYWDSLLLEVGTGIYVPGTVTVTSTAGSSTVTTTYTDVGSSSPNLLTWSTNK